MTNYRRQLRRSQVAGERAIDRLFRDLVPAAGESVRRHAETDQDGAARLTPLGAARVRADIDALLDRVYGSRRGGPSPLEGLVVAAANAARSRAVTSSVDDLRRGLRQNDELAEEIDANA